MPHITIKWPEKWMDIDKFADNMVTSMPMIAKEGVDYWKTLAGQRLKSSRVRYQKAINIFGYTESGIRIGLEKDSLAAAMEVGSDGWELHPNTEYGKIIPLNQHPKRADKRYVYQDRVMAKNLTFVRKTKEWKHPGFKEPLNYRQDVAKHLCESIIPFYIKISLQMALGNT